MSGGGFHRYEIAGHYKGLEWPSTVYGTYFARLSAFAVEFGRKSLAEKFRFQRWCLFGFVSSDRGWAAAVLTLDAWRGQGAAQPYDEPKARALVAAAKAGLGPNDSASSGWAQIEREPL